MYNVFPAPVEDLTLYTNNSRTEVDGNTTKTVFDFEKLKPAFVSCVSKGIFFVYKFW